MEKEAKTKIRFRYRIWSSFVNKRYTGWRETDDIHSVLKRYDCDDEHFDTAVEGAAFYAEVSGKTRVLTKLYYSWNRDRSLYRNLQVMIIAEPVITLDPSVKCEIFKYDDNERKEENGQ